MVVWNYDPLTPRQPNDPPKSDEARWRHLNNSWSSMDSDCGTFASLGWDNASGLCRHFLNRTGEERYIDMPSLIDDERPLWASFEHSIRWEVNDLMDEIRSVPADSSRTLEFTSQWRGYSISPTAGDWWGPSLGTAARVGDAESVVLCGAAGKDVHYAQAVSSGVPC